MKKALFARVLFFSIIGALSLSLISLFCLVRISDMVVEDYRYGYLLYIARSIEKSSDYKPVEEINVNKYPAPPVPKGKTLSLLKITEFGPPIEEEIPPPSKNRRRKNQRVPQKTGVKPSLWLVSQEGEVLSTTTNGTLPVKWEELPRPKKIHGIESNKNFFLFRPKTFIIKLDTRPTTYLVSHNERSLFQGPFLWVQGIHTFTTAALAVFFAISICFYYLRRKSTEARKVLGRLESGDLKARFEIKKFDEFGSLILDFNRMADEIEHLVKRLSETESSRSNLLQELGHDLRTPLTSLSTAFETLEAHHTQMSDEERTELFSVVSSDIVYFKDLLEKLTLVATIDEPHYKASTEKINLSHLLQLELKSRQTSSGECLQWNFVQDKNDEEILGDYHLITRLFKNALDNASRYAHEKITVRLRARKDQVEVLVIDDGPGLTPDALESFGKRRERRQRKNNGLNDFSLGLGSVIMKSIVQAHGGSLEITNNQLDQPNQGACLKVKFQRAA
jgi:signal transduction histidine kinase